MKAYNNRDVNSYDAVCSFEFYDFVFEEAGPFAFDWTAKVGKFTTWNNTRDFYKATPLPVEHGLDVQSFV